MVALSSLAVAQHAQELVLKAGLEQVLKRSSLTKQRLLQIQLGRPDTTLTELEQLAHLAGVNVGELLLPPRAKRTVVSAQPAGATWEPRGAVSWTSRAHPECEQDALAPTISKTACYEAFFSGSDECADGDVAGALDHFLGARGLVLKAVNARLGTRFSVERPYGSGGRWEVAAIGPFNRVKWTVDGVRFGQKGDVYTAAYQSTPVSPVAINSGAWRIDSKRVSFAFRFGIKQETSLRRALHVVPTHGEVAAWLGYLVDVAGNGILELFRLAACSGAGRRLESRIKQRVKAFERLPWNVVDAGDHARA